jgi:hypothetical protein
VVIKEVVAEVEVWSRCPTDDLILVFDGATGGGLAAAAGWKQRPILHGRKDVGCSV